MFSDDGKWVGAEEGAYVVEDVQWSVGQIHRAIRTGRSARKTRRSGSD